jgi:hypothetical protein
MTGAEFKRFAERVEDSDVIEMGSSSSWYPLSQASIRAVSIKKPDDLESLKHVGMAMKAVQ